MFYKCLHCGHIMEDDEVGIVQDDCLDFGGVIRNTHRSVCSVCGDDIEEAVQCKECGSVHFEDDLINGYCSGCVDLMLFRFKRDPIACFSLVKKTNETEPVRINSFLASMFTEDEIEHMLLRELVQSSVLLPVDCTAFINSDKSWFVEAITSQEGGG